MLLDISKWVREFLGNDGSETIFAELARILLVHVQAVFQLCIAAPAGATVCNHAQGGRGVVRTVEHRFERTRG